MMEEIVGNEKHFKPHLNKYSDEKIKKKVSSSKKKLTIHERPKHVKFAKDARNGKIEEPRSGLYADYGADFKYFLNKPESDVKKNRKKESIECEERERMQALVSHFTEEQLDRYEMYRRSAFPKASVKRYMQMITGNNISHNVVIAMSGLTKVFIGEVVEEALDVMESQGIKGPIQPKQLREAVRRLRLKGKIPTSKIKR